MTLMRFLDVIRGVLTAAPTKLLPVMKIPLQLLFWRESERRAREPMDEKCVCVCVCVSVFLPS